MKGTIFINDKDAYDTWGITFTTSSLSALMTPPPMKDYIESNSRLLHGRSVVVNNPRTDSRDVSLTFNLTAKDEATFFARYASFCEELKKGMFNLRSSYQPDVTYKMIYQSCSQFTQFVREMAVFSLKLIEPNCTDRQ